MYLLRSSDSPAGTGIPKNLFEFMMRDVFQEWFGLGDIKFSANNPYVVQGVSKIMLTPKVIERLAEWFPNTRYI